MTRDYTLVPANSATVSAMASKKKTAARKTAGRTARKKTAASRPVRRKPESLRLRGASPSFTVDDVQKSLAFYRDVLGFTVDQRWEGDGVLQGVELKAGDVLFMLAQDDWKKGRDRKKGVGFRLYCSTVQDVDVLAERIRRAGGQILEGPRDEPWGARAFTIEDPDGFKITISRSR
jgi:lactoylglutathione lyase